MLKARLVLAALLAVAPVVTGATDKAGRGLQLALDRVGEAAVLEPGSDQIRLSGRSFDGYYRAYACPSFAAARAVIGAIPAPLERPGTVRRQVAAMKSALSRQHCAAAKGTFRILDAGEEVMINHGYEAEESWIALAASGAKGRKLGLVFDASPYAPGQ